MVKDTAKEKEILKNLNVHLANSAFGGHKEEDLFKDISSLVKDGMQTYNPLLYALEHCMSRELQIKKDEIHYLIDNSDLSVDTGFGKTALTLAIIHSDYLDISMEQYDKLIESCPQTKANPDADNCDLLNALIKSKINFSAEMWKKLIRKTNKEYFSKEPMTLLYLFARADYVGQENIEIDILINKLDVDYLRRSILGELALYASLSYNQTEMTNKIIKKMGAEKMEELIERIRDKSNRVGSLWRPETIKKAETALEILRTKETISEKVKKGVNGAGPGNKI